MCALVKFGAGVSELRGKEGGVIYSRNAYGSYMKAKVTPVNPNTAHQSGQRALMGNLSQAWTGLSAADKASWVNLGEQTTRVNVFGDTTYYTGFSLFVKLNRNIVLAGGTVIDSAPVIDVPAPPSFTSLAAASVAPSMSLAFTPTVPAGAAMFVYATNNILTGRSYVKNYYRLIKIIAAAQTSPQDIYTSWNSYFGNLLVNTATIFVKIKNVNLTKGWETVADTGQDKVADT